MIPRLLNISKKQSFFLFGARGTGKTSLLRSLFTPEEAFWIDLLELDKVEFYDSNPEELEAVLAGLPKSIEWVVIDEIQKVPNLLNVVHRLIETKHWKFALTCSSTKKLKAGGANLLAGRALLYELYPLTSTELGDKFDLLSALRFGTLPSLQKISDESDKIRFLDTYALLYLREEVWNEHLVRKLNPFRKFLQIAAQCSGELINYSNIAKDTNVDYKTVQQYFQILEDTLLGQLIEPYAYSVKKRQKNSPKFYFFDNGVKAALDKTIAIPVLPQSFNFGLAFEQFIINEIHRLNSYGNKHYSISFLRTEHDLEVDVLLERPGLPTALIEIKSTDKMNQAIPKNLAKFTSDFANAEFFCLSRDPVSKTYGKIKALHWRTGLTELGL